MDLTFSELDEYNFEDSGFIKNEIGNVKNEIVNVKNEIVNVKNEIINVNANLTPYTNYWHRNQAQKTNSILNNNNNNNLKPLTYDDILNSLNLKVQNGNLEFIQKTQLNNQEKPITQNIQNIQFSNIDKNIQKPQLYNIQNNQNNQNIQNIQNIQNNQNNQNNKLSNIDKNSYIYNKYFKDYNDKSAVEEPKKPMTREEYIQEYNRKVYEKKIIDQIKSKKLMFNRENNVNITVSNPNHNLNRLFRM